MNAPAFFNSLIAHWPGAFFRQRIDLSCEFVASAMSELTGVAGKVWLEKPERFLQSVHPEDRAKVKAHIDLCRQIPFGQTCTFRICHAETSRIRIMTEYRCRVHEGDHLVGYDCVWLEGAEAMAAEKRFNSASWKETVGVMTMGLAHDYNNALAGMLSFTELFLAQIDASHPFHEGLGLIRENARKSAQIIERIVQLHQAKLGQPTYHDLNEIVKETVDLLQKAISRRIDVITRLSPQPLPLFVDALELRQVICNLALNATDAMPEGGKLVFETSLRTDPANLGYFIGVAPRLPSVCLEVSDSGGGIDPADLHRLFDPYFTTRFANQGTGLGLHTARLFVERYDGAISVESLAETGATFRLWLPRADFTEAEQALDWQRQRPRRLLLSGSNATRLKALARFWRAHDFEVVIGHADAEVILLSGEPQFDALLLALEADDAELLALATRIRRQKLPLKIVLLEPSAQGEEPATEFFDKGDLVLPPDLPPEESVRRLRSLLA